MNPEKIKLVLIDRIQRDKYFSDEEYLGEFEVSFPEIKKELDLISEKLFHLLPDKSIGPEERVERLARLIPSSIMESEYHRTARKKLEIIERKLNTLVPRSDLSNSEKIDYLVTIANTLIPEDKRLVEKLETIGEYRRPDNGKPF